MHVKASVKKIYDNYEIEILAPGHDYDQIMLQCYLCQAQFSVNVSSMPGLGANAKNTFDTKRTNSTKGLASNPSLPHAACVSYSPVFVKTKKILEETIKKVKESGQ